MKKIIIYTDGGARSNPGPSAIACLFCNEKNICFKKFSEYVGEMTNNEAEYKAAIFALKKFKSMFGKKLAKETEVEIRSDSQLLVNQMEGKYKILEEHLKDLFLELWNLKLDFKKVRFSLINRKQNQEADKLVNETLDSILKSK